MPTGAKNGCSRSFTLRMPNEIDVKIRKISEDLGVSVSQVIIMAIREYLQKEDARG